MAGRRTKAAAASTAEAESGDSISFENALERLEEIVDRLEQGDLELEGALASFEEGVKLSRQCAARLEAAERRIEVLVREGGEWLRRPFEGDPEAAADAADDGD